MALPRRSNRCCHQWWPLASPRRKPSDTYAAASFAGNEGRIGMRERCVIGGVMMHPHRAVPADRPARAAQEGGSACDQGGVRLHPCR